MGSRKRVGIAAALRDVQSLERVRTVWRILYSQYAISTPSTPAALTFHPSTLVLPSAAPAFIPSSEWTALRESIVYAEFLLLTCATEFSFNNALTGVDHEGREGTPFHSVQRLLWQLMDEEHEQEQDDVTVAAALATPAEAAASSSSLPLRCSRLAWNLTQAAVRSSILLHSNAFIASIAIVYLAAFIFRRKPRIAAGSAGSAVSAMAASSSDAIVQPVDAAHTPMSDHAGSILSSSSQDDSETTWLDLDARADVNGWAPPLRVVESAHQINDVDDSASAMSVDTPLPVAPTVRFSWYHALCPTLSEELLLALCEIIIEAAVAAPPVSGSAPDAADLQLVIDSYPWGLSSDVDGSTGANALLHNWSNANEQKVVVRQPQDALLPYEDPYPPRIVLVCSQPPEPDPSIDVTMNNRQQDIAIVVPSLPPPSQPTTLSLPAAPSAILNVTAVPSATAVGGHSIHPSRLAAATAVVPSTVSVSGATSHPPAHLLPANVSTSQPQQIPKDVAEKLALAREAIRRIQLPSSAPEESKQAVPTEHAHGAAPPTVRSHGRHRSASRSRSRTRRSRSRSTGRSSRRSGGGTDRSANGSGKSSRDHYRRTSRSPRSSHHRSDRYDDRHDRDSKRPRSSRDSERRDRDRYDPTYRREGSSHRRSSPARGPPPPHHHAPPHPPPAASAPHAHLPHYQRAPPPPHFDPRGRRDAPYGRR
jgi:hypothetical protein